MGLIIINFRGLASNCEWRFKLITMIITDSLRKIIKISYQNYSYLRALDRAESDSGIAVVEVSARVQVFSVNLECWGV